VRVVPLGADLRRDNLRCYSLRTRDVRLTGLCLRAPLGQLRQHHPVRVLPFGADLRRDILRDGVVHAADLCLAGLCLWAPLGRLRRHHPVWVVPFGADLRGDILLWPVYALDVHGARQELRHRRRRLRRRSLLRLLQRPSNMRRQRGRERLRRARGGAGHARSSDRRPGGDPSCARGLGGPIDLAAQA